MANDLESQLGLNEEELLATQEYVRQEPVQDEHEVSLASYEQSQVFDLARTSLDFLAALCAPSLVKYLFPPVFISAWNWLLSYIHKPRDFSKLALGLPRGFGKTTFAKFFIIYTILFTTRRYIIVISATEKHAINIITDVCTMLANSNIIKVFGDYRIGLTTDTQAFKVFGFRGRTIMLEAIGKGGAIRGTNRDNERPDLMIFEDIQTREEADSKTVSESIEQWMIGTAMKAKSPSGCLYIFVANMYPTRWSILRKLKANPSWTKFIVGGILADGTSLWEELQPIEQLMEEFQSDLNSGHPEIFYAEVLNDEEATANSNIDLAAIPPYPFSEQELSLGDYIIIDPSNDKANSDAVSIGHFSIRDGKPVLMHIIEDRLSPGDTVREAYRMCFRYGATLIAVEANAYQYSLLYWFNFIAAQLGIIGIECVPIYSGTLSKVTRILNMFKELLSGDVLIHPEVQTQVHYQISQFKVLKRDNVDGILDLLTYSPRVIAEYGDFIAMQAPLGSQEIGEAHVLGIEANCSC
jgi:hypothetical protein